MKHFYAWLLLFGSASNAIQQQAPVPGLGTTHFVVGTSSKGMPPVGKPVASKKVTPQPLMPQKAGMCYGPFSCNHDGSLRQVFFSPDEEVREKLIYLIDHEQQEIKIAVFTMTERAIADALVRALQRGVTLSVIVDPVCVRDRHNKVGALCDQGVCTYVYNPQHVKQGLNSCMHHKFALFTKNVGDKKIVWTGSFNFTRSASVSNHENALVLDDPSIINRFERCFETVRDQSYRYKMHKKNHAKA